MGVIREVSEVLNSVPTVDGAGVHLQRAFGPDEAERTDPFLQLDDLRSSSPADYLPGYPWHPHRGIETITYMLSGSLTYSDCLGNRGVTTPGEVMWMTAGSGVVHREMPRGDRGGRLAGVQIWTNLPADTKMRPPRYMEIIRDEIPEVLLPGGGRALVIAGCLGASEGAVQDLCTASGMVDLELPPGGSCELPVKSGHTAIGYLLSGDVITGPSLKRAAAGQALLYEREGDTLALTAGEEGARLVLMCGEPLHEPIAWQGPIVMNSAEELDDALRELQEGTFVKDCAAVGLNRGPD